MESVNLLIFTVYIIVVTYVFYQAYKSLENQVTITLDKDALDRQLEEQELKSLVEIKFKLKSRYSLDGLKTLPVSIKNISDEETIRVDWDESSITDFDNVTGRVIRITSGMTEIPQGKQTVSVIVPGRILEEELSDDKAIIGPLFKPVKLKKAMAKKDAFYLRLFLTVSNITGAKRSYTLRCPFIPKKLRLSTAFALELKPKPTPKKKADK